MFCRAIIRVPYGLFADNVDGRSASREFFQDCFTSIKLSVPELDTPGLDGFMETYHFGITCPVYIEVEAYGDPLNGSEVKQNIAKFLRTQPYRPEIRARSWPRYLTGKMVVVQVRIVKPTESTNFIF